jgi:transposase
MSFTWYGNQSEAESSDLGPLAVIFPLIQRMRIAEIIDQSVYTDPQADFSAGTVLSLLVAARLYSPMALTSIGAWAEQSGADILFGIPAEKLNDDRLGRALEGLFEQRHTILAHAALHVSKEFDVPLNELHYDPTHLLFEGAYENSEPREGVITGASGEERIRSDDQLAAAHITKGRATDDAPKGASMVHVGLATYVDEYGPLPLFGHTVDGNQNGRKAVDEYFALMRKHLKPTSLTMISDRGTFSVGHLLRLKADGFHAICSAPWADFSDLFASQRKKLKWKKATYLSIEQQRRRKAKSELPQEHYELAVVDHRLQDKVTKGEVDCRVIFVFSTADQKVVRKQRQKHVDYIREDMEKIKRNVARRGPHSDEASISRRIGRLYGNKEAAKYFSWSMVKLSKQQQARLPKPGPGRGRPTHRFEYSFDEKLMKEDEKRDGYSVVVTTVPKNRGSADTLFTKFKQQNYSEQINRGFKGPLAVRPIFLHKPERVEALVFLMILVLMLYYLLQRLYRQSVPEDAPQKEKQATTRTILKAFQGYTLLIHYTRLGREVQPTRLSRRQRQILQQLGFETPAQILSKRLPRPPT